jgi:hypothetical protein
MRRHNPEDLDLNLHSRGSLKSIIYNSLLVQGCLQEMLSKYVNFKQFVHCPLVTIINNYHVQISYRVMSRKNGATQREGISDVPKSPASSEPHGPPLQASL